MMRIVMIVVGLSSAWAGCGGAEPPPRASRPSDIAAPGTPGVNNKLVWFDDGVVSLGLCPPDALPIRANCPLTIASPYDPFEEKLGTILGDDVNAKQAAYTAERNRLREADARIIAMKAELAGLRLDVVNLSLRPPVYERVRDRKTSEAAALGARMAQYDSQIAAVEDRLADDPGNADLQRLLARLTEERGALLSRQAELGAQARRIEVGLAEVRRLIEATRLAAEAKAGELADLYEHINVTSPQLELLKAAWDLAALARARLPRILGYVRDGSLAYRYDLLDAADKTVVDRMLALLQEGDASVRLQGPGLPTLVLHDGEWRAICDDRFDEADARVICRSKGKAFKSFATEVATDGRYWLDRVECSGTEQLLRDCRALDWGIHDCDRHEGVSVICE